MTGLSVLRAEIEGIEASIGEIRKQELDVDTRLGDIQREKNELAAVRGALEEAVNVLRSRLTQSAPSPTVVQFPTSPGQHVGSPSDPQSASQPTRKGMRRESGIGRSFTVIENLMIPRGGSARREQIIEELEKAELLPVGEDNREATSHLLSKLKHRGYLKTDYNGTWSLTGTRP